MTRSIFITADPIGAATGGGKVTQHELAAMASLGGGFDVIQPRPDCKTPFEQDEDVLAQLRAKFRDDTGLPELAHVYAGCFSQTCQFLHHWGVKVTYTVAAHDVAVSRKAHEEMGWPFPYPHLTDPDLFRAYIRGYIEYADVVICPSRHSADVVCAQGRQGPIEVIQHGTDIPNAVKLYTGKDFRIGYMGAVGPDKGLLTLFRAWGEASKSIPGGMLVLAGSQSKSMLVADMMRKSRCGPTLALGWVDSLAAFYGNLSCYVQSSASEGFALEVLEAMAHGVPVLCSTGAGASELVPEAFRFPAGDHHALANAIVAMAEADRHKDHASAAEEWRKLALPYSWDKIESRYAALWSSLL